MNSDSHELVSAPVDTTTVANATSFNVRKIAGNVLALLTSDVFDRMTTFIMYALVGRYLGAYEFGQVALALTLFYTFRIFASAGLKILILREVAKDRTQTAHYLVNGAVVVSATSLCTIVVALFFIRMMNYAPDTVAVIQWLTLGLLPYSLAALAEGVFQAWERMNYIAYASVTVNLVKLGLIFLALTQGYGIHTLAVVILVMLIALACLEWWLLLRNITKLNAHFDATFAVKMIKATSTFLGIDGIIAIRSSILIVLLSTLADETTVGLYSAATQILVPLQILSQNVVLSLFPAMCRRFAAGIPALRQVAEQLIGLLLISALPASFGLFYLADTVLLFLYGDASFLPAAGVLRILAWTLLLKAANDVLGQLLWASSRERMALKVVILNTLLTLIAGSVLTRLFGLLGAAWATLFVAIINFGQHYMVVRTLLSELALGKLLWKPVAATVCMGLYLYLIGIQPLLPTILSAGLVYGTFFFVLEVWVAGGMSQFAGKYQSFWPKQS